MLSEEKQAHLVAYLQAERDANDTGAVRKQRMQLHDVHTTMDKVSIEVSTQPLNLFTRSTQALPSYPMSLAAATYNIF